MGYTAVPASTPTLCKYAVMLARTHKYSSIRQYLNIVNLLHREFDLPNPLLDNFVLTSVLKGIRRSLGDKINRKAPMTPRLLTCLLASLDIGTFPGASIWAAALVLFFAMLRRSNLLPATASSFDPRKQIRRRDIHWEKDGLVLTIRWSKTIQFGERTLRIPLPRIKSSPLCPVQAVYQALSLSPNADPEGPLFLAQPNGPPLTVPVFIQALKRGLQGHGVDSDQYAGHSFRRGGASWFFQCGVGTETIRLIGDWKSACYTQYITESPESLKRAMTCVAAPTAAYPYS